MCLCEERRIWLKSDWSEHPLMAESRQPDMTLRYLIRLNTKKPISFGLIGFFSKPEVYLSSKILFPQIRRPNLRIMQQLRGRAFQDNPPRLHHISPISQL